MAKRVGKALYPGAEQLGVEAVTLAVPGGVGMALSGKSATGKAPEGKPIIAPAPAELPAATLPLGTAQMNEMARQDVEGPGPQVQANELSLAREDSGELVIAPEAAPQEVAADSSVPFAERISKLRQMNKDGALSTQELGSLVMSMQDPSVAPTETSTGIALVQQYDNGEIAFSDLVAQLEKADNSPQVDAALQQYNNALAEDRDEFGKRSGLPEDAQDALLSTLRNAPAQPTAVTSQVEGEVTASQVVSELPDVGDQTPVNMDGRPTRLQEPQPTAPDSSAILQQEPRAVQETDRELAARTRLEELAQRAPEGIPTETFTKQWNSAQAEYDAAVAEAQPGRENLDAARAINRSATPQETIAAISKRSLQPSVTRQVRVLLNSTMRAMSKAATGAWRAAAKNAVETRKNLIEYAKQRLSTADLTDAENRRLVALVAKSGLETDPAKRTALQRSVIGNLIPPGRSPGAGGLDSEGTKQANMFRYERRAEKGAPLFDPEQAENKQSAEQANSAAPASLE